MPTDTSAARARAEANFRKEERAKDGAKAMMEYQAQNRATRERMAQLRAQRLAKEAADQPAPEKEVASAGKRSRSKS